MYRIQDGKIGGGNEDNLAYLPIKKDLLDVFELVVVEEVVELGGRGFGVEVLSWCFDED